MESILLKVPMGQFDHDFSIDRRVDATVLVVWPGGFDQPLVANELVKLGVARELIQIREGK